MKKPRTTTVIVLQHRLIMPEIFYKQNLDTRRTEICPTRGLVAWFRKREKQRVVVEGGILNNIAAFSRDTSYYYYRCGGERDTGWGCAYRCVQMMLDCVQRVFNTGGCKREIKQCRKLPASVAVENFRMPSIRDMQVYMYAMYLELVEITHVASVGVMFLGQQVACTNKPQIWVRRIVCMNPHQIENPCTAWASATSPYWYLQVD